MMPRKEIRFLVLFSSTISLIYAGYSNDIVYKKSIYDGGQLVGNINIYASQEPVDAIYSFSVEHGLSNEMQNEILDEVCMHTACTRRSAMIWSTPVSVGDNFIGIFELIEGVEPVDAAQIFVTKHRLPDGYRNAILSGACEVAVCSRLEPLHIDSDAVYRKSINIGDTFLGDFVILKGEEPADSVYRFCLDHNLDKDVRSMIMNDACQYLSCEREEAILWNTIVRDEQNQYIGEFILFEGIEPVDAAHAFSAHHKLSVGYRNAILAEACAVTDCSRIKPAIWEKSISIDGSLHTVLVLEDDDPAQAIFDSVKQFRLPWSERVKLIDNAKRDGIVFPTEHAKILSRAMVNDGKNLVSQLILFDDGREPVDVLHRFLLENDVTEFPSQSGKSFLQEACSLLQCKRQLPVVWKRDIFAPGKISLGNLEILMGEEPVDAVDAFIQSRGLGGEIRSNILKMVCDDANTTCQRLRPVVFRKQINDGAGGTLGSVEVYENEEVVDAVVRFIRTSRGGITLDEIQLKNHFFQVACSFPRLKCTRNVAVVFDSPILDENGENIGQLQIKENDEPADAVSLWSKDRGLDKGTMFRVIHAVCEKNEMVVCNRRSPLVFGPQSISGPDGEVVGILQVELGQEPIDAIYAFFAMNDLFEKKWDLLSILDQICILPALEGQCKRRRALKYYNESFILGNVNIGPVVIWEDEEPIDMLYNARNALNLTYEDQMTGLNEICKNPKTICDRTSAEIYRKTDINIKEYGKFGNETCNRNYAGFQYLSSFADNKIGMFVTKALKKDVAKMAIEQPLLGPAIFWVSIVMVQLVLYIFKPLRSLNFFQRAVLYIFIFMLMGCVNYHVIEPVDDIDKAMYLHEGKLPDLVIYEGDEPVDAILQWAKEASRKHHPIVRQPIHDSIQEDVCERSTLTCTRKRAWEPIDMGSITFFGQAYKIEYMNPVDQIARRGCNVKNVSSESVTPENSCIRKSAKRVCMKLQPIPPANCYNDIYLHIENQLRQNEENRIDSKDTYKKLGLEMDAPGHELFEKMSLVVRHFGQNLPPFQRVDNGSSPIYYKWDVNTNKAYAVRDAFHKIKDPESREWNDKPCEPMFGGALCAKTDKDGNMQIEC